MKPDLKWRRLRAWVRERRDHDQGVGRRGDVFKAVLLVMNAENRRARQRARRRQPSAPQETLCGEVKIDEMISGRTHRYICNLASGHAGPSHQERRSGATISWPLALSAVDGDSILLATNAMRGMCADALRRAVHATKTLPGTLPLTAEECVTIIEHFEIPPVPVAVNAPVNLRRPSDGDGETPAILLPERAVKNPAGNFNGVLYCYGGCGRRYADFGLDVIVPTPLWNRIAVGPPFDETQDKKIDREGRGGVLCAQCIVDRLAKLPGVTVGHLTVDEDAEEVLVGFDGDFGERVTVYANGREIVRGVMRRKKPDHFREASNMVPPSLSPSAASPVSPEADIIAEQEARWDREGTS